MINYKKSFDMLNRNSINTNDIRKNKIISESALQAMRRNEFVSLKTIDKLCKVLNCQPGDLIEYVPDDKKEES